MRREVLERLKRDDFLKYLRQNSDYYKYLNRDSDYYDEFVKKMKEKYKLRILDKVDNFIDNIDLISKIIDVSKK